MKEERKKLTKHPLSGIEPETVYKPGQCSTDWATETGLSKRQVSQLFLPLKDAEPLFPADPTAVAGSHHRRFPYHSRQGRGQSENKIMKEALLGECRIIWNKRGKNRSNLRQESNLRPFTNRANALPTELRRQVYPNDQSSQLFLPLNDAEPPFPAKFFLCLILTASRVFCDFLPFSINLPRVISYLHYIPIRLVKARVC